MIVLILKFRKDKTITHGPNVIIFFSNVYYVQTNYNEVVVLQQGGDVLMEKWQVQEKKNTHERQRDVRENEETKNENGSSRDNL